MDNGIWNNILIEKCIKILYSYEKYIEESVVTSTKYIYKMDKTIFIKLLLVSLSFL